MTTESLVDVGDGFTLTNSTLPTPLRDIETMGSQAHAPQSIGP
jgi:hypothetical protein